jgi:hypothetical protein
MQPSAYLDVKFRAPDGALRSPGNLFPSAKQDLIRYLATGLCRVSRFNGYGGHYSVAQHSCLVADLYPKQGEHTTVLALLLHDSAESILGDVPKPWKAVLPDFQKLEQEVNTELHSKHKLPVPGFLTGTQVDAVGHYDHLAFLYEAACLFGDNWEKQFGIEQEPQIPVTSMPRIKTWHGMPGEFNVWDASESERLFRERLFAQFRKCGIPV